MDDLEIKEAMAHARHVVEGIGRDLLLYYGNVNATRKDNETASSGVITWLDKRIEMNLRQRLRDFSPKVGFRGEELGPIGDRDVFWLIDPIDGTSHYTRGLPFCTVMLALIEKNKVLGSIIYDIAKRDTYWAIRNKGAFCNNTRISVSTRRLDTALIAYDSRTESMDNQRYFMELLNSTKGLFNTLNSGYEFAMVACGKIEGRICFDPYGSDWDYAPGMLLVAEAGGVVEHIPAMQTESFDYRMHNFIASNPFVYKDLIASNRGIFMKKLENEGYKKRGNN